MRRIVGLIGVAALLQPACTKPQLVAHCELRGTLLEEDCITPVPGVRVWALYDLKADQGNPEGTRAVGPFLSDAKGRFLVPRFEAGARAIQQADGGTCPVRLLFIHPNRGAFAIRICPEDYPPSLPGKDMVVHQAVHGNPETIRASYQLLSSLPPGPRATAWQQVDPAMRPH